jgi:flagellin
MRIQNNVPALNAHRYYGVNQSNATKSMAKLSSGYRINSAADDAAGLAISEKMRAQIRGLTMASKNAQDGISLIQTAEGGLQEIDNMLQRIRELVVYASNDTQENNSVGTGDRQKIKDEIDQLTQEIDSMAERVEFNKKKLLNGSCGGTKDAAATGNLKTAQADYDKELVVNSNNKKDLNDYANKFSSKLSELGSVISTDIYSYLQTIEGYTSGTSAAFKTAFNNIFTQLEAAAAGTTWAITAGSVAAASTYITAAQSALTAIATTHTGADYVDAISALQDLVSQASAIYGESLTNLSSGASTAQAALNGSASGSNAALATAKLNLYNKQEAYDNADGGNGLYFQIGANANQGITVNIGTIKTDILNIGNGDGISTLRIPVETGADITGQLEKLDYALSKVTTERSKLGAVQNRLEYTMSSLDISAENLTAAESRIRDVDMAKEMTTFTKHSILFQASTAMLAQANAFPQGVLQLLG